MAGIIGEQANCDDRGMNRFAALAIALAATAASGWVQILPAGSIVPRDGRGPFSAGDRSRLDAILSATKAWLRATEMPIDYEHQTLRSADNGRPAPASGWVKEFEVRDDGLWGRVEWTAAAAAAIQAGEYRYLSPVIGLDKDGNVVLVKMAALTNTPATDLAEVEALAARAHPEPKENPMEKILKALGLAADASEDTALTAIATLSQGVAAVALAAGLAADAKPADVALAVTQAVKAGKPDPAQFAPVSTVTALTAEVAALRKQLNDGRVEAVVDAALKAGKIVPAMKEWATDFAGKDIAAFEAFVAVQPEIGGKAPLKKPGGGEATLDETDEVALTALGLDRDAFIAQRKKETA